MNKETNREELTAEEELYIKMLKSYYNPMEHFLLSVEDKFDRAINIEEECSHIWRLI